MIEVLKPSQYRRQRWKNGGGVTDEIAADADNDPPAWRISVASIDQSGPFSDFRGYDRTIVPLEPGITLTVDGTDVALAAHEPFDFRGESQVSAQVTAPARDLNAMTLRAQFAHDTEVLHSSQRYLIDDDELVFVYVLTGSAIVSGTPCEQGDTVYVNSTDRFDVAPGEDSAVCVIHVTPR